MAGGIDGLDKLMRKFGDLGTLVAEQTMIKAVGASAKLVQAEARTGCPVDTGELRQSIRTATTQEWDRVIGVVYTNKEYARYVEFGTGPVGEANHQGISPNVTPAYSQTGWFIPVGADSEGKMRYTEGQPAQPFLYPALKNNEERVMRNISNYISRAIREVVRNG